MSSIHAIGFDLFNTLITVRPDALSMAIDRLMDSLAQNALAVDRERFAATHRRAALVHVEKARENGRETHNRFWISSALQQQGMSVAPDDQRIARALDAYFSAFYECSRTIPGTRRMLRELGQQYRLGLLSNFTHAPAARTILDQLELSAYFETLVISGELGYRKPHERTFQALCKELNLPPEAVLYVGDDPECDVYGALAAGLHPVWSTYVRDRNIPAAPGIPSGPAAPIDDGIPRINDWQDLFEYLETLGSEKRFPTGARAASKTPG